MQVPRDGVGGAQARAIFRTADPAHSLYILIYRCNIYLHPIDSRANAKEPISTSPIICSSSLLWSPNRGDERVPTLGVTPFNGRFSRLRPPDDDDERLARLLLAPPL